MNRIEYFNALEISIVETLIDTNFDNFIKQMFAWKVGARFGKTYDETYVWRRALYLSSSSCKLLQNNKTNNTALKALKQSAEIYEYLSEITESFDKDFCFILSALCYDISGYQANALCMMRNLLHKTSNEVYTVSVGEIDLNTNLGDENYILFHVQQILLKQIPLAYFTKKRSDLKDNICEDLIGINLFDSAVYGLYEHILRGHENSFLTDIYIVYKYYLSKGNVFISHLLQLLTCRFDMYAERSIWNKLNPISHNQSSVWGKYIRLLSNDIYEKNKIKNPKNRRSIFEFWVSQLRAIEKGILESNESYIIQMPTSAGKTFIAELAILESLTKFPTKKCVYVAPFRALTNEKENELAHYLSKLGYSVSSLSGDYELDEFQNFILYATDVLIATPEKLDLLYRLQKDYFQEVALLIIDEGHIIGDVSERAALLEFLIIRLKMKIPDLKIIFISAVLPEINGTHFSSWLSGKETNVIKSPNYVDNKIWEPTRKLIGKFSWISKKSNASKIVYPFIELQENGTDEKKIPFVPNLIQRQKYGRKSFPNKSSKGQISVALAYKLSEQGSTLVFASRPDWAIGIGEAFIDFINILNNANLIPLQCFSENTSSNSYHVACRWLGSDHTITQCIKRGVGIHFGDLPDAVRKSIETDYRAGVLKILISTNTVGQGLNFPIKNLIVHSLDINPQKGIKVGVRDFWNIIGRAGRAGKETEGQVVFLGLNSTDDEKFKKYTNIDNIDNVQSLFALLVSLRLSDNDFAEKLAQCSEPFLLSILAEEIVETDDQALIEKIIDNSLFKVQVVDIVKLKQGLLNIVSRIRKEITENKQLQSFASNGFNLRSNQVIEGYILENLEALSQIVNDDDYQALLIKVLQLYDNIAIKEIQFESKIEQLNGNASILNDFILNWIRGESIDNLSTIWLNSVPAELRNRDKMFVFLSQGLNYRYAWGITAFLTILTYKLNIEIHDLPNNIKSLAGFVKSGVNNNLACFALSLGIRSRELATFLAGNYNDSNNYEAFIGWINNLTIEEIRTWNIDNIEKENIIEVALKLNTRRFTREMPEELLFAIKGTYFFDNAKVTSRSIQISENIEYERDFENDADPFAIKLLYLGNFLGYIPRELAKSVSIEIDLFDNEYQIEVTKIEVLQEYNKIHVKMKRTPLNISE